MTSEAPPRQVTVAVVDGTARYDGETLAGWVPTVIRDLVSASDLLQVILFGSVARAEDGPDSDITFSSYCPNSTECDGMSLWHDCGGRSRRRFP